MVTVTENLYSHVWDSWSINTQHPHLSGEMTEPCSAWSPRGSNVIKLMLPIVVNLFNNEPSVCCLPFPVWFPPNPCSISFTLQTNYFALKSLTWNLLLGEPKPRSLPWSLFWRGTGSKGVPFKQGSKPEHSSELPGEFPKHRLLLPPLEKPPSLLRVKLGNQYLIVIPKTTGYLLEYSYCGNVDGTKRKPMFCGP